jgi:hypothetical protein
MAILSSSDPSMRVYLAAPYTGSDTVRKFRARAASKVALDLILRGHIVFSPVSHGHALVHEAVQRSGNCYPLPVDFTFWQGQCFSFLHHWAEILAVLRLRGWKESVGVTAEIAEAQRLNLPIVMLELEGGGYWYELDAS